MTSFPPPVLHWFRRDLRLTDNPALWAAADSGAPLVCLYILDPGSEAEGIRPLGAASRWWLHHSLTALDQDLSKRGGILCLRRGNPEEVLPQVMAEIGASALYVNHIIGTEEPRDQRLYGTLQSSGRTVHRFNGTLLHRTDQVKTKSGTPFRVFSPFWKTLRATLDPGLPKPIPSDLTAPAPGHHPVSDRLTDWALLPTKPDWAGGLRAEWSPGETGARARLDAFLAGPVDRYKDDRNIPSLTQATSRLSPHLRFGEIGPRQVWAAASTLPPGRGVDHFLSEVAWREFSHHLLAQWPSMATRPLRPEFAAFPWSDDPETLKLWQTGRTGYPIVDAAMRELWETGYMHNRTRMIAGSFLVKNLLIPWQQGEAWFWDTLVDACPANNTASWQWVAGCGADAAPYFRIFNPMLQAEKFDSGGAYVRRWLPELADLPDRHIHKPWEADTGQLPLPGGGADAASYPGPMVDHHAARDRALAAYKSITAEKQLAAE